MQHNFKGQLLTSTESDSSDYFYQSTVYICEHNEQGAWGVILSIPFNRNLNELTEFQTSKPFPLFEGGPVEKEKLFFLHRSPTTIQGGLLTAENIYWGGDFKQAVAEINAEHINYQHIKLFVGYCGWDKSQLEEEVVLRYWKTHQANPYFIFNEDAANLWNFLNDE